MVLITYKQVITSILYWL